LCSNKNKETRTHPCQFYDGNASPRTGTTFTVTPKSYFSGVSAGGTLTLGFQLTYAGSTAPTFTSLTLTVVLNYITFYTVDWMGLVF
jgi:hypothetical protein